MALTLNHFEFEINPTILERGLRYYKKGLVTDVTELGGGRYEVIVEGSETYTVNLEIKGDRVGDYRCDCPYDAGPVCKHIAAALFALQGEDSEEEKPAKEKTAKKKTSAPKKKTIAEQINELFDRLPAEELQEYVRGLLMKDRTLRNSFLAKYAYLVVPMSKELYERRVKACVEAASKRYGFIDYSGSKELGSDLCGLAAEAQEAIRKGNFKVAIYIAGAILEQMSEAMNILDDSGGYVGGALEEAVGILDELSESSPDEPVRKELFDYLLDMYKRNVLGEWDWHTYLMTMVISLIRTPGEKDEISAILDAVEPAKDGWDWKYRKAQELKRMLIARTGTENERLAFMEQNLSNPDFREEIVEKAIKEKDYEKAIRLLKEGIKECGNSSPGIVNRWKKYLLTVYSRLGNKDESIRLTRYFVLNESVGWSNNIWQDYYLSLKEYIAPDEWPTYLESLVKEIYKKNRWIDYERIFNIYALESDQEKLYELLAGNLTLERLEKAEKYLKETHINELITLYKQAIHGELRKATGRSHYRNACRYIRRMIKLSGRPEANQLIEELKQLYPNRPALREELDGV